MKCNSCGCEWNATANFSQIANCPFCGSSLLPEPEPDVELTFGGVIKMTVDRFGTGILTQKTKFLSIFTDFAPEMTKEKKLLSIALDEKIGDRFASCTPENRDAVMLSARRSLDMIMAEAGIDLVLTALAEGLGWQVAIAVAKPEPVERTIGNAVQVMEKPAETQAAAPAADNWKTAAPPMIVEENADAPQDPAAELRALYENIRTVLRNEPNNTDRALELTMKLISLGDEYPEALDEVSGDYEDVAEKIINVVDNILNELIKKIKRENLNSYTDYNFYFPGDEKFDTKLAAAKKKYANFGDETPLLLMDYTVFGSAKEGFVLTEGCYYSHFIMDYAKVCIDDIKYVKIDISNVYLYYETENGLRKAEIPGIKMLKRQEFCNAMNRIIGYIRECREMILRYL